MGPRQEYRKSGICPQGTILICPRCVTLGSYRVGRCGPDAAQELGHEGEKKGAAIPVWNRRGRVHGVFSLRSYRPVGDTDRCQRNRADRVDGYCADLAEGIFRLEAGRYLGTGNSESTAGRFHGRYCSYSSRGRHDPYSNRGRRNLCSLCFGRGQCYPYSTCGRSLRRAMCCNSSFARPSR
jgi:hypothetical protein